LAHGVAWEIANGPIGNGIFVCHRCDNPACVRPSHLFLGTHKDNMADMRAKGRQSRHPRPRADANGARLHRELMPRGESHGMAVLDEMRVREIRDLHAAGEPKKRLARRFGVSPPTITSIVLRRTWAHVTQ
jgi:hypothetical protein